MTVWSQLRDELDHWADLGRVATLWWRDDDAARLTHGLERLLGTRSRTGVPLALAAIPAIIEEDTSARIDGDTGVDVLQHGYAHRNHAPPGQKKSEFDDRRPVGAAMNELSVGARRLHSLFGKQFVRIMVPPWNRIADQLVARLSDVDFAGISTFGPRRSVRPTPGLIQVNTHIDVVDWPGTRGFVGVEGALGCAIRHLQARRAGEIDDAEPTGLLSHHLVHDEDSWRFIEDYIAATKAHSAVCWVSAREAISIRQHRDRDPWSATAIH